MAQTAIPTGKKVEPKPGEAADSAPAARPGPGGGPPPDVPPGSGGPGGPGGPGRGRGGFGPGPKPTEVHQFVILCLDRATGNVRWQQVARGEVPHEGYRQNEGSFASASDHVYCVAER